MHKQQRLHRGDPRFSATDLAEHEVEWAEAQQRLPREERTTAAAADAATAAESAAWFAGAKADRDEPGAAPTERGRRRPRKFNA